MKILHIIFSDEGGAAIGLRRLHEALKLKKIESEIFYFREFIKCKKNFLLYLSSNILWWSQKILKKIIINIFTKFGHKESISMNIISPINYQKIINKKKPDIVHLHWLGNEMISAKSISNINKPVIWTMHDMWPFCGTEHFVNNNRFSQGYKNVNRPPRERGIDLNKIIWKLKKKYFLKKRIHIICPSKWIGDRVEKSLMFKNQKKSIIPYILNLQEWKIQNKKKIQSKHLKNNSKTVIFFSATSSVNHRKGFNYLYEAIEKYLDKDKYYLLVAGVKPNLFDKITIEKKFIGQLTSQKEINLAYNLADIYVMPSIMESFGQVYIEAGICGIPSVAFKKTAAEDIIQHKKNGYLADYKSSKDLAFGIDWIKIKSKKDSQMSSKIIKYTNKKFSAEANIEKIVMLYKKNLANVD